MSATRLLWLSDGEILPRANRDFENHCCNYFVNAKENVVNDAKLARPLSSFYDYLVNDWIAVDVRIPD